MWGYQVLPSAQWFAAFLALIMSAMLIFWVSESAADTKASAESVSGDQAVDELPVTERSQTEPDLESAMLRLDALKSELTIQYAQFGRDQALVNSNGLGSWHRSRTPRNQ